MGSSKVGQRAVLQPIPQEVWVPIDFELIKPEDGYFISTHGRVAKLHVGPNPYGGAPWAAMIGVMVLQGNSGMVAQFEIRKDGVLYKKRYMLTPLFAHCFIGDRFVEIVREFCKKVPKDTVPDVQFLGKIPNSTLIKKEGILDAISWSKDPEKPYNIWNHVLGDPGATVSEAHLKYRDCKTLFCPARKGEFIEANGLVWRPVVLEDVSEIESYWISATGIVVQYPNAMSGPNSMKADAVRVGVDCKMISPLQSANGVLYLKNTQGTYSLKSLRKLVYNVFIDPEYDGKVQTVLTKESAFCGTNVLLPAKA